MIDFLQHNLVAEGVQSQGPILALDTSTQIASLALLTAKATPTLHELSLSAMALPSESLFAALLGLLQEHKLTVQELAGIVVGLGPGSFTGLRVGLASAKGLALGSGCKIFGTSSLAMAAASQAPGLVIVARDARRASCYLGLYRVDESKSVQCLAPERCCPVASLGEVVAGLLKSHAVSRPVAWVGDFFETHQHSFPFGVHQGMAALRAGYGLWQERERITKGMADDAASLVPRYLQSGATLPKK